MRLDQGGLVSLVNASQIRTLLVPVTNRSGSVQTGFQKQTFPPLIVIKLGTDIKGYLFDQKYKEIKTLYHLIFEM